MTTLQAIHVLPYIGLPVVITGTSDLLQSCNSLFQTCSNKLRTQRVNVCEQTF